MTNEQLIEAWDSNRSITTCNMGGMGDGYEHVIHVLAMEILRSMLKHPAPAPLEEDVRTAEEKMAAQDADHRKIGEIIEQEKSYREAKQKEWRDYSDLIEGTPNVKGVIQQTDCTGAQFGAAMNIASVFLINGYDKGCAMIPKDRLIQIQKDPNVKV